MKILSHLNLRAKLILLTAISGLALVASIGAGLTLLHQRMIDDRVSTVRAAVGLTMGLARSLEDEVVSGKLNREQALSEMRDFLHTARFGAQDEYLIALSVDGMIVVNGAAPEREGKMAGTARDQNGKLLPELVRDVLRHGTGGVVSYQRAKPGTTKLKDKFAYVQIFEPWQLVFIAATWTDDLDNAYREVLRQLATIVAVILMVTLFGTWIVSSDISRSLGALRVAMERLASGDLAIEPPGVERRDEVGEMAKAVVVFQAEMITVRRLSVERALSEQRLRDYVATASDWHWETDAQYCFTMIAAQAREHGIDRKSLIGLDRLNEDDAADAVSAHREILDRRQPFSDLRHDYATDRGLLTISLSGLPVIGENGEFQGYRGSARDITEQMRAEALQRTARWAAVQANNTKSNFLATMSHEIRTPMNGVLGMLQLLRQTALDDEQRQMCDTIFRSGKSLLQILNDILDYSKLEAHKIELDLVPCHLPAVVHDVVSLMGGVAEAKGLTLAADATGDTLTAVSADSSRLRQVLTNLVSNSIKFSERGKITIGLHTEVIDAGQRAVALTVSDQGIGISPKARLHLFQRFSQADSSISRRFGGTGLGLAITRELVGLMGGEIAVASVPGEGTTFTVNLKFAATTGVAEAPETFEQYAVAANTRTLNILVAEDDAINQAVIRGMLAGHHVTLAGNGEEAVRLAVSGHYDVILMDVMMPVMDGVVATGAIRALAVPASNLPIIALTANAVSGDRERYLAAGMNGYVSKPIEQDLLLRAIEQLLGVVLARPVRREWKPAAAPEAADTQEFDEFIGSIGV